VGLALAGCFHKNQLPVAKADASPQTGLAPLNVQFSGASSTDADGKIESYSWDFGDGATGSGVTVSHTYTRKGTYEVTLTVKDNKGGTGRDDITITVDENKAPVAKIEAAPKKGTAPLDVDFDGSASSDADGDALTYRWDFGDGSPAEEGTDELTSHTYTRDGTFTARLTVRDTKGASSSDQVTITVEKKPVDTSKTDQASNEQVLMERTYATTLEVGKTYTITVKATAKTDVSSMLISEVLPDTLQKVEGDLKGFGINLARGATVTITYKVKPTQAGEITITGKVFGIRSNGDQFSVPLVTKLQVKAATGSGSN
jgi:PKD repeat protein